MHKEPLFPAYDDQQRLSRKNNIDQPHFFYYTEADKKVWTHSSGIASPHHRGAGQE